MPRRLRKTMARCAPVLQPAACFRGMQASQTQGMSKDQFAPGVTAEHLRTLLDLWPSLLAESEEIQQNLQADKEEIFTEASPSSGWCYLYELPIREHLALAITSIVQNLDVFLSIEQVNDWFAQIKVAQSQIGEIPSVYSRIGEYFNALPNPDGVQAEKLQANLPALLGNALSMINSLRSVLYYGCYLNELIERVRAGDDDALFDAVRLDASALGCPSIVSRISKASMLKEEEFFNDLKNAINGTFGKRERENFKMMRLVFEVLHEAGASRLTDQQLHKLFVAELNLYARDASPKNLRKHADTYMKKNATT